MQRLLLHAQRFVCNVNALHKLPKFNGGDIFTPKSTSGKKRKLNASFQKSSIWKKTSDVGRKCHLQITFAFEELMGRVLMCFQKKKKKKVGRSLLGKHMFNLLADVMNRRPTISPICLF